MKESLEKSRKKPILCPINISDNRNFYVIMLKNTVDPDMTQMTIQYGGCALHAM
jgi:hypothetical protein